MKDLILQQLQSTEDRLRQLRSVLKKSTTKAVSKKEFRDEAEALANRWVEELRSPLEHKFKLPADIIAKYATGFRQLHILSRPSNLVTSYVKCLDTLLRQFKNDLVLPVQQSPEPPSSKGQLKLIVSKLGEEDVSDYLAEAIACADNDYNRASIVMGWCATIDHIQKKLVMIGLDKFNAMSTELKKQTSGRFKRFNKEFHVTTINELQEVFDTDLLWVLEGMQLIDSNQGDRLRTCFQYRNQSAHPGEAPIGEVHINAFFNDIIEIVLANEKFALT
jgi:hypothetical protein